MTKDQIVKYLKESDTCLFWFTKVDGMDREMRGTLNSKYLPAIENIPENLKMHSDSSNLIHVWDLDKNEWRSVRIDSIYEMWADTELVIPEPYIVPEDELDDFYISQLKLGMV